MTVAIHCGSFLLLAATVLLLVATISAPVVNDISFLDVTDTGSEYRFGVFGYCQTVGNDACSPSALGYNIASVAGNVAGESINTNWNDVTKGLILHPIATGLSFIAFIIALCSSRFGFLFASLVAFIAFIASLAAMILDFVLFGAIRHDVNEGSATAEYSVAIWLVLAATVILFFAQFFTLFECCTVGARRRRERNAAYQPEGYVGTTAMGEKPRRSWWRR